ncbi:oxidoreductase [Streptomyces sp. NPDC090493]|uniref:oxidoreductase n=1 Tax=Streptomyces sp. NPDC090493 TaxID=3365964 RepID=UPI00381B2811
MKWTAAQVPDMSGRTFVVTGANSGLGLAATRALAQHGARVVMAVRSLNKGHEAAARIHDEQPRARLEVRDLDLADLESVRGFAVALHADGVPVDVLINNAGVMAPPHSLSPQGFESQFAAGHLGHFALTGLLLRTLSTGRDPRVVTVSSMMHRGGRIHFDDLNGTRHYAPQEFYQQAKFAQTVFALELHRRLGAAGSPVRSLLAHPGYTATNLATTGPRGLPRLAGRIGNRLLAQNVTMGVLPQLYASTAFDARGGQFYGPDGLREMRGHPTPVKPDPAAEDPTTAQRLWELSESLTGIRYNLSAPA